MWNKFNAKCENWRYMRKNNPKCEQIRLSKCVKHFDSKCVKIDAICANFILTLFAKSNFNAFLIPSYPRTYINLHNMEAIR